MNGAEEGGQGVRLGFYTGHTSVHTSSAILSLSPSPKCLASPLVCNRPLLLLTALTLGIDRVQPDGRLGMQAELNEARADRGAHVPGLHTAADGHGVGRRALPSPRGSGNPRRAAFAFLLPTTANLIHFWCATQTHPIPTFSPPSCPTAPPPPLLNHLCVRHPGVGSKLAVVILLANAQIGNLDGWTRTIGGRESGSTGGRTGSTHS